MDISPLKYPVITPEIQLRIDAYKTKQTVKTYRKIVIIENEESFVGITRLIFDDEFKYDKDKKYIAIYYKSDENIEHLLEANIPCRFGYHYNYNYSLSFEDLYNEVCGVLNRHNVYYYYSD